MKIALANCLVAACGALAAFAAPAADLTPAQRYQQQRADCLSGRSPQDRATCLREAGAALAEARRGGLSGSGEADWQRNAQARCQRHTEAVEREACMRIARGEGTQDGSVEEGAILYELVTRSVEPAASEPQR